MTTNSELGRRLVACKHFRWMPGMLTTDNERVVEVDENVVEVDESDGTEYYRHVLVGAHPIDISAAPDLTDPATIGCLLALVREAWGDDGITATIVRDARDGDYWYLDPAFASTEAEVLVAALEAAP